MASLSKAPPSESSLMPQQEEEEEEEVEEDVDFNPLLKVTASSSEASSSLSSEIEGLNRDAVEIMEKFSDTRGVKSSNLNTEMQRNLTTEFENVEEEEEIASCGTDVNDFESGKRKIKNNPTKDLDNEDDAAICTRTRARYSLASCTLDELETFLQETDDEDDLQNIDDEQEYRKFLTAVLHGQENENVDEEEDEDNDADFEIELEEALALEGNLEEESPRDKKPETRQNKRQKQATAAQHTTKRRLLEQTRRSLRPLLPILPYGPATAAGAALSIYHGRIMNPENANASSGSLSLSKKEADLINGFTIQQIGQLYCLIHEHVQLLIQVFSLCIYDSSRQHIASQAQGLISQMLQMRNEVLKWKAVSYPSTCFFLPPPYACPSSIPDDEVSASSAMVDGTLCVPFVTTPVQSVLDVAPLNLVGRYMDDVCGAVQESRRRWCYMEPSPDDTHLERESLFSLPGDPGFNCELPNRTISSSTVVRSMPSSPTQQPPKKTLAATLVESTKKHSVALVPKEIAKLARGFIPLFNPTLFPRKPPPPAVVNRVLFTDTEDE